MPLPSSTKIKQAIWKALTDDIELAGLLPDSDDGAACGVYFQQVDEDATAPYVIFSKASGTSSYTLGAGSGPHNALWNIRAIADDPDVAEEIDEAIQQALTSTELPIASPVRTLYLQRESDLDYSEPDSGIVWHHVGGLYRLITQ